MDEGKGFSLWQLIAVLVLCMAFTLIKAATAEPVPPLPLPKSEEELKHEVWHKPADHGKMTDEDVAAVMRHIKGGH